MGSLPFLPPPPRVVSAATAADLGLSADQRERRVRAGVWVRLADGVYCTSPPVTTDDLLHAGSLHAAPHGMLTGAAALTAHGFSGVGRFDRVTVLVPYAEGIRSTPSIQVRRAAHLPDPVTIEGLAVAPAPRAVVDHAMTLRWRSDVRALLARAVQRHGVRVDELDASLRQVATRGSKLVRACLAEIAGGARSAPEAEAGTLLRQAGVTGFEQNVPLSPWGLPYVADFLWKALRAVLEIDSREFHYDDEGYERTLDRGTALQARGLSSLHVTPQMIRKRPEVFVSRVRAWLTGRAALLGVAPPFAARADGRPGPT